MLIDAQNLDLIYRGFKANYTDAYLAAEVHWNKIAMTANSSGSSETYGWIGAVPQIREWLGQRVVHSLAAHTFTITNRKFESTVSVPRDNISDDKLGVFSHAFALMGQNARTHPEELVFNLLASGFTTTCFDGQSYFDADHPQQGPEGATTVSNVDAAGAGPAWFLLDTSKPIKPIIWQEREPYEFTSLTRSEDANVFFNEEYIYGVRARVNAGFGFWQLAYGSTNSLNTGNYAAARAAMMNFRSDQGRLLGIKPTTLVVPPALEHDALHLINAVNTASGASNPYAGTAELIVTPWLSSDTVAAA